MRGPPYIVLILILLTGALCMWGLMSAAPIRGKLTVEGTNYWVRWTNLPQRFRLEHSSDMQQWRILLYMTGEEITNFQFFEYPLPHGTNQVFYRIVAP